VLDLLPDSMQRRQQFVACGTRNGNVLEHCPSFVHKRPRAGVVGQFSGC
jgi:hypothetical protein